MKTVLERFLSYVAVDTESKDEQEMVPSTEKQRNLAAILAKELEEIGASNVRVSDHCYVYATIPSNLPDSEKQIPTLGFVAHVDTSPALSGKDVKARVVKNYDGEDILLNKEKDIVLSPQQFPALLENIGEDLVVTDGTTLLGADDKAGVAEIMTMAEYLLSHKEIPHGTIQIAFTPDEEVGRGVDFFDVEGFGAQFAYTIDGGVIGEIEYENFNAAGAKVEIHGTSIHPGSAKGQMVNAILLGMELQHMLPVEQNPAYTEGYEGFFHLDSFEGCVEHAMMDYIIRDHDKEKFEIKKEYFKRACDFLNEKYGEGTIDLTLKDSYYNMKEMVEPHMHLIENAKKAMEELGIVPKVQPIRGGTDGARLSFMGIPCPNLCTGGANYHGKYEYISVQSMEKTVEIILRIIKIYTEQ